MSLHLWFWCLYFLVEKKKINNSIKFRSVGISMTQKYGIGQYSYTDLILYVTKKNMQFSHGERHGCRVVTLSPPTSEAGVRFPARPQVGKLVVACHWSAVYSTEP